MHSEYNNNQDIPGKYLQIWILPDDKTLELRYDEKNFDPDLFEGRIVRVASGNLPDTMHIHQDVVINRTNLRKEQSIEYSLSKEGNGVHVFVFTGNLCIGSHDLNERDAVGIWDTSDVQLHLKNGANLLLIDVPIEIRTYG